jgi:hypothetical protein
MRAQLLDFTDHMVNITQKCSKNLYLQIIHLPQFSERPLQRLDQLRHGGEQISL